MLAYLLMNINVSLSTLNNLAISGVEPDVTLFMEVTRPSLYPEFIRSGL